MQAEKQYLQDRVTNRIQGDQIMERENIALVIGALDSLGLALANHDHQWTEGERAIYDLAIEILIVSER